MPGKTWSSERMQCQGQLGQNVRTGRREGVKANIEIKPKRVVLALMKTGGERRILFK